jgi:uncharacterized membrane protein YozB (DUF420 family)
MLTVEQLPALNATLNGLAAVMLVAGWVLIKRGRELAHRNVSVLFLISYLVYHFNVGSVKFTGPAGVRAIYLVILFSHIVLAATVPILAVITIYLGLKDRRRRHRQFARWTFPIWLYVSITGVVIYVMLYHIYPAAAAASIMQLSPEASIVARLTATERLAGKAEVP